MPSSGRKFSLMERSDALLERHAESLGGLRTRDAIKTYRYLRIGMIGAVALLGVSIIGEWRSVESHCFQTSISAYYYTPVRAIFVGSMIAVGLALIAYKGRSWPEDLCLNIAGMLAPVVAVAPTTDVGRCWSVPPESFPRKADGTLAAWVIDNINNNFYALLIAGVLGLVLSIILVIAVKYSESKKTLESLVEPIEKAVEKGTGISLTLTAVGILIGWLLIEHWGNFYSLAHGWAAVLFFFFLGVAIVINSVAHRKKASGEASNERKRGEERLFRIYAAVAVLMVVGFIVIPTFRLGGEHTVFWLEAWEILLFAVYWIVQTADNWDEKVLAATPADGESVSGESNSL